MKQFLITIGDAIKRGILRIFPKSLQDEFTFFQKLLLCSIILTLFCILVGCGTSKQVTQLVEYTKVDTVYLSNVQYDSIYIYQEKDRDYRKGNPSTLISQPSTVIDTLYIKDKSIEYRYKLLRDTVYKTRIDSIPYQVTVVETKEITRPKTTFDIISYWCFGIVVGIILFLIYRLIRKFI